MRLVSVKDLPSHLQFNPRVKKGYRPPMSLNDCLNSICYVHNESFNIYSHGTHLCVLLEGFVKKKIFFSVQLLHCAILHFSHGWITQLCGLQIAQGLSLVLLH